MAEVVISQNVVLKMSDAEWRLVMKGLAAMAGVKNLKTRPEEQEMAGLLNKQLLLQRIGNLNAQLKTAEDALTNTESKDTP